MSKVSMENPYLTETTLTSTKNKYLNEENLSDWLTYNKKRKLLTNLLHDWKITHANKKLTTTESILLKTYSSTPRKKRRILLKAKKIAKYGFRSRSISRDGNEEEDELDTMLFSAPCMQEECLSIGNEESSAISDSAALFDLVGEKCRDIECAPRSVDSLSSNFRIGGQEMNLRKASSRVAFCAPAIPRCPPTAAGFSFGSSPGFTFGSSPGTATFGGASFKSAPDIFEMPVYNFDSHEDYQMETSEPFDFINSEASLLKMERIQSIKSKKMQLLNAASMALICKTNLKDASDPYRLLLTELADSVRVLDPEFILKIALYSRQELNIRSASNFMLAYAAYYEETRLYLRKYFEACIRLPSDWIEVAEFYQVFDDQRLKKRSLPASLKRVMMKSFSKFDVYQLAKYNRDKSKRKNVSKVESMDIGEKEEKDEKCSSKYYTLKQLIRMLHINSPANEVMCLLGKKYPETAEAFKTSGLPGTWDPKRSGIRMKLPQPETWETQISQCGNTSLMWESLIDNSKLPYMAMLRNLRNLILSGISTEHHEKVLKHLENKVFVLNSRQLPLQFYEAFKILLVIEEQLDGVHLGPKIPDDSPVWKKNRLMKTYEKIQNASLSLLERYKNAVSKALELSALHNLQPIPGKTLVICDILPPDNLGITKTKKAHDICVMMGLMCLKACEDSKLNLICGDLSKMIVLNEAQFLQAMVQTCSEYENMLENVQGRSSVKALKSVLDYYLKQQIFLKERLDHVIYLRTYEANPGYIIRDTMTSFLHKYRQLVNPELLYTDVDFSSNNNSFMNMESSHGMDVYLCGNTTQLIKFIAERSSGGQLTCVENIDEKYNLVDVVADFKGLNNRNAVSEKEILPILTKVPKWRTVRIFISSTFRDMHSERDMLIRFVIPELRKRAASVFVKINEVDLRWGITETDCASKRAAELCLLEAEKSDLFIGILGDRYGTIYNFDPPESPDLHWVKECPPGLSITELEMHAGALNENKLKEKKSLFYLRNNSFLSAVPEKWKGFFMSENLESKQKIEALKSKILSSGLKVYEGYPCKFAGVLKEKPVLSGLDVFGKAVLEDLWRAVSDMHNEDPFVDDVTEEEIHQQHLLNSFEHFVEPKNFPVTDLVRQIQNECGIFLISGAPGSGKTSFVVNILPKLKNFSIVKFFIGLTPRSTDISYMLNFICESISRYLPVSSVFPKLTKDVFNQFPDILYEAVNSAGSANFVLVLDGLDHLEINDQMLDWLPLNLPPGLRLVCTTSDSSYAFRVLCQRETHGTNIHVHNLLGIVQSDRECIVRHYLKLYGKTLDESPFNNQMLQLVTKKDSNIPLYLRIACDFLRTYASFENFMSMLQSLPSTIPLLFQEIILQMENEYTSVLVQAALTLLCITTEGLDDADLHLLLSLALLDKGKSESHPFNKLLDQISKLDSDNLLSKVTYCSLVHLICTFAYGHNRFRKFNLAGTEFEYAVKKFYLNKNYTNFATHMHCNIAAYYQTICDPNRDGLWKGRSASAYRGLVYHLFNGKCYKILMQNLCCLKFLESAFSIGAADSLLEYYALLLKEAESGNNEARKDIDVPLLTSFIEFVSRNLHIFQMHPCLVIQQAVNEPSTSLVKSTLADIKKNESHVVECLSIPALNPRVATFGGFVKSITAASCLLSDDIALLGSEDGYLKVLDFMSKKIIRNIKSHSSAITFICFVGKNQICTASSDTTLSIWSSVNYSRTFVLKGHRHTVSCCCADPSSSILFSSSWDNSVRLWSLRDGRSISIIDKLRSPVNCLDHHHSKQQIACGLWNGNIELWDTVSLMRLFVLSNNCRSVKSIAYMPDGISLVSSYMNSDVVIWSLEQGLKMSNLKGHALPVRSISFSTTGDMIVSGSEDSTLKVWPTEAGVALHTISACKFCSISVMEIISPNILAICFQNSDIWMVDFTNGVVISKMSLQSDIVSCISKTNTDYCDTEDPYENWTDSSLVFGTQSGELYVGTFLTSSLVSLGSMKSRVTAVTHNKRIIVSGNSEGDIGVFSYLDKSSKIIYGVHGGSLTALCLYINNDDLCFISTGSDKVIKVWTVERDELIINQKDEHISKHSDYITSCSWFSHSNDNCEKKIITGSHDNNVILQGGDSVTIFKGLKTSVECIDFTDNNVLGCGSDGSVAIWSKDGKLLSYISGIEQSSAILAFRIDKDSSRDFNITLAFVDKDGCVKIRKPIERSYTYSLEGHSKGITSCCINPNREIVSCSLDRTVNLWKLPMDIQDTFLKHSESVTDIISLKRNDVVLSSDVCGSIILWELVQSTETLSLVYGTKKTYMSGFVKSLTWLKDKDFACAVTQTVADKEVYFLDILSYECTILDGDNSYNLWVKFTHYFESEILCINGSSSSETIVAAFKSGDFVVINSNTKKKIRTSEDWILHAKILQSAASTEYIYFSLLNGSVKRFKTQDILKCTDYIKASFEFINSVDIGDSYSYTSAFCCESEESVFCGDTKGWLRIYSKNNPSISKKVHDDSLTGITVIGNFIFTSSLDRTLKGWNSQTLEQVCLYHSFVPITCLEGFKVVSEDSIISYTLMIGTGSGSVQLLKFHCNK